MAGIAGVETGPVIGSKYARPAGAGIPGFCDGNIFTR